MRVTKHDSDGLFDPATLAPIGEGAAARGRDVSPSSARLARADHLPFGRLVAGLAPFQADPATLQALGAAMNDVGLAVPVPDGQPEWNNPDIPAGYTYLGQFIDHDLTLDVTPLADPAGGIAVNKRTSRLDLDSVYAGGPALSPGMYVGPEASARFLVGTTEPVGDFVGPPPGGTTTNTSLPNDLPRIVVPEPDGTLDAVRGQALIGDARNDENLVVAQLHLAFLKFHNRLTDILEALLAEPAPVNPRAIVFGASPPPHVPVEIGAAELADLVFAPGDTIFERVRATATLHYQWVVVHDFLARICDPGVFAAVLAENRFFAEGKAAGFPEIPVEFSAAAYRFGHSMVRADYDYNRVFPDASLALLFTFTGGGGGVTPRLPTNWVIAWDRFFRLHPVRFPNPTRNIDTVLSKGVQPMTGSALPGDAVRAPGDTPEVIALKALFAQLAIRNLLRGLQKELPSAQDLLTAMNAQLPAAEQMGPLTENQVASTGVIAQDQIIVGAGLERATPLWFYVLREAATQHQGRRLGQLGSRIVAEVLIGTLRANPASFLARGWTPSLATDGTTFTMAELLRFVGDVNPLGG
jgi:hypothetical protein